MCFSFSYSLKYQKVIGTVASGNILKEYTLFVTKKQVIFPFFCKFRAETAAADGKNIFLQSIFLRAIEKEPLVWYNDTEFVDVFYFKERLCGQKTLFSSMCVFTPKALKISENKGDGT